MSLKSKDNSFTVNDNTLFLNVDVRAHDHDVTRELLKAIFSQTNRVQFCLKNK